MYTANINVIDNNAIDNYLDNCTEVRDRENRCTIVPHHGRPRKPVSNNFNSLVGLLGELPTVDEGSCSISTVGARRSSSASFTFFGWYSRGGGKVGPAPLATVNEGIETNRKSSFGQAVRRLLSLVTFNRTNTPAEHQTTNHKRAKRYTMPRRTHQADKH